MRLIQPKAVLISKTENPEIVIEKTGRICYKSEHKTDFTKETAIDFCKMIMKRNHESVLEHVSATVTFTCDRGISHELVRHRIASYSQESTRYCNYRNKDIEFILPCWMNELEEGVYDKTDCNYFGYNTPQGYFLNSLFYAEETYYKLLEHGWRPQQARNILPNSLKTEIAMTANAREWRHFLKLRTAKAAHPQMRELAFLALKELKKWSEVIFSDFEEEGKNEI